MQQQSVLLIFLLCAASLVTGCHPLAFPEMAVMQVWDGPHAEPVDPGDVFVMPPAIANPTVIPANNPELFWEGLADVIDDYFRIKREDRVREVGDVLVEGRLETHPLTGATVLEPWRKDSVGAANRLESTLQTIRRIGYVRVVPTTGGYLVELQVLSA